MVDSALLSGNAEIVPSSPPRVWILKGANKPRSRGKVSKSTWWMPWHKEAMKDVISCDKPRGGANTLRSVDLRMGKPGGLKTRHLPLNT